VSDHPSLMLATELLSGGYESKLSRSEFVASSPQLVSLEKVSEWLAFAQRITFYTAMNENH
jgi:hypothetical protein